MEEKNVEEIIKNLKVLLFDIIAENEAKISVLEQAIIQENDEQKEEELRTLWAKYNNFKKTAINTADVLAESLKGLKTCEEEYINTFQSSQQVVEAKDPIEKVEIQEEKREEVEQKTDPIIPREPVEEAKEAPSVEQTVEEVKSEEQQEAGPVVTIPVPEVAATEEKTVEETPVEEVVEQPVEEQKEEIPAEQTVEEVKSEEQQEAAPVVTIPVPEVAATEEKTVEETPVEEVVAQPVEEAKSEEQQEAAPEVAATEEKQVEETPVEGVVEQPVEETKEENQEVVAAVQLPTIEENVTPIPEKLDTEEVVDDPNKIIIMKNYDKEDRAILINQTQASKLRISREMQTALYQSKNNSNVTEQQLEEMLGQVTALYEEGKTKEAEELSNQINELSKTFKKTA